MRNLVVIIVIIALVLIFLKMTGFLGEKKFELPKVIHDRTKQAQESVGISP